MPTWIELDRNPSTKSVVAGRTLYQLHDGGRLFEYTGPPMTGWREIDANPATVSIAATQTLYQLHNTGHIYRFRHDEPPTWELIDENPSTSSIQASGDQLFQLHRDGKLFRFTGVPMTGWELLDANPATAEIVSAGAEVFQRHNTGRVYRYRGTPQWELLDENPATVMLAAGNVPGLDDFPSAASSLYQLHNDGRIFRYVGSPVWQEIDSNPATIAILALGLAVYQLHSTGRIFVYTGTPHVWTPLDENPQTTGIVGSAITFRLYQLHADRGVWLCDGVAPGALPREGSQVSGVEFGRTGIVIWVSLDNERTEELLARWDELEQILSQWLSRTIAEVLIGLLRPAYGHIDFVNRVGGRNGVEIAAIPGAKGLIVTPRRGGLVGQLVRAARLELSGATILDAIVAFASRSPGLAHTLSLQGVAAVVQAIGAGTPFGWAVRIGVGLLPDLLLPEPDPNEFGEVMADRDAVGPWESFLLAQVDDAGAVALLSWLGFLSAESGGGHGVYANRPSVGAWETWRLIRNSDGTISLRTVNGHYLCAEEGGARECQANRLEVGEWEKFWPEFQPDGKFALKTKRSGKYVSVQS